MKTFVALFWREAVRSLMRHKFRSALTALGVMIGVGAIVLVVGVGEAGKARAEATLQALGENLVWVEAGSRNLAGLRTGTHGTTSLLLEDAEAIRREVPLIIKMSPQVDGTVLAISGNRNWTTRYRGETPEYLSIKKWEVALGAPFSHEDVTETASKVLLGQTVRDRLFGASNPVGELIRIQAQLFEVVGVMAPKGQSPEGRDQDDWILLPFTTAHAKLRGKGPLWLDDIVCSAVSPEMVVPAIDQIVALLRQRHHIPSGAEDDFNIRRPDELVKAQVDAAKTLELFLISIASISLLVGGIGIMNVMLASVAQRYQEIGVRLAFGATQSAVQIQFLGEAVVLSIFGGITGVALSAVGSFGLSGALGWTVSLSVEAVALALVSSITVGVCFGYYPARRASRLDPIEALRD